MTTTAERVITYLLVEDSDAHAEIVEQCFGYAKLPSQIRRVSRGADCLAYLAGEEPFADRAQYPYPDVVLLDIHMPGVLDGFQTLKAIRSDPRHRSLMVMMLTTSDRDPDVSNAYDLGANGYIVKSDDTEEMIEKLMQLQHSFESCVQLPESKQQSDPGPPREPELQAPPSDVEPCYSPTRMPPWTSSCRPTGATTKKRYGCSRFSNKSVPPVSQISCAGSVWSNGNCSPEAATWIGPFSERW